MVYRLPRNPSAPRLAVWRSLRRFGAVRMSDGLVALPWSARNHEHLEWLSVAIGEAEGTAEVWIARPASVAVHYRLVSEQREERETEYRSIFAEARKARSLDEKGRRRAQRLLRAELCKVDARDYFEAPTRQDARAAVEALVDRPARTEEESASSG